MHPGNFRTESKQHRMLYRPTSLLVPVSPSEGMAHRTSTSQHPSREETPSHDCSAASSALN
eukprot:CAMPEP_0117515842 /NCGR_PEP_ID=MMETSP0784-20121206/30788_1 /TAXON_ID=39447 /ORGANISM="" /LENGTH=60 /DNA_ID=CAMNT_0005311671 /DNA_START=124 /DNA_END=303 /DNA_ORIENTATION=+